MAYSVKDIPQIGGIKTMLQRINTKLAELESIRGKILDQINTAIVENFVWSAERYPDSTNPNLDGKAVFVFAVTGNGDNPTTSYSFVDMDKLIDVYTAGDRSITISGYQINVRLSTTADNAITLENDGLYVNIGGKIDKVTGGTAGNIATLTSDGGIADSTYRIATNAEFAEMLDEVFPVTSGSGGD